MALLDPQTIQDYAFSLVVRSLVFSVPLAVACGIFLLLTLDEKQRIEKRLKDCGLSKIGNPGESNLIDQYDPKYRQAVSPGYDADGRPRWRVKAMYMFPIKSCAPIELSRATIVQTGIKHDRHFTFVKWHNTIIKQIDENGDKKKVPCDTWDFITQRAYPKMSQIKADVWVPDVAPQYPIVSEETKSRGCMVISFPHVGQIGASISGLRYLARLLTAKLLTHDVHALPKTSFVLPLEPTAEQRNRLGLSIDKIAIWKEHVDAVDMSNAFPPGIMSELKNYLGVKQEMSLFRTTPEGYRPVFSNAPRKEDIGWQPLASLTDSYPLNVANMASLHDLAGRLPEEFGPLTALRFRANFYVTGPAAYDEDDWKGISIGGHYFHVACRATRCNLPNVNPESGALAGSDDPVRAQPYKALSEYRDIDAGGKGKPCFGMMMVPGSPEEHEIYAGDELVLISKGEHCRV